MAGKTALASVYEAGLFTNDLTTLSPDGQAFP
jgi:hypothetical protein